jgi:hypothetical protein
MGINSTSVAYNFGQMGAIHVFGNPSSVITAMLAPVAGVTTTDRVFVAITFLEDTVFASGTTGLKAETTELWPDSTGTGTDIDANGGGVVDTKTFPAGLTIFGRWTGFQLSSGRVIAYLGY